MGNPGPLGMRREGQLDIRGHLVASNFLEMVKNSPCISAVGYAAQVAHAERGDGHGYPHGCTGCVACSKPVPSRNP